MNVRRRVDGYGGGWMNVLLNALVDMPANVLVNMLINLKNGEYPGESQCGE